MRFRRFIQTLHRWLGLAIGVQIVIWMTSGVVMSLLPIAHVRGETAAALEAPHELVAQNYFPPAGVISEVDGAQEVMLKTWLGREVYVVSGAAGNALFDADTGERLSPLNEANARRVAESDFAGEGEIAKVSLLNDPPREFGRPGPVWRADFNDGDKTRLYISPDTGVVLARRNRVWRFYDFFWMLHIMDYKERENFNNPLVRTFAITGLLFALSGLTLVVFRLQSGRYAEDTRKARMADRNGG
ncbi:MAG: PepSY domain-containing protein [Pseudomonadota bacterium]